MNVGLRSALPPIVSLVTLKMAGQAARAGRDPNVWFDQLEIDAARNVGKQTVQSVGTVYKYYVAQRLLSERRQLRDMLLSGNRRVRY